ncbi:MAG: hypothetical protein E6Q97_14955 [Desulfurellales bacterium]|nr:MAG: hypothetical protein E6Q97_14955 [Desulfurellales bacterium]
MSIGTKSVLFGVHQFAIHPWFVALAWWKLYGFPFDPRLWVAFFVHDLGYIGKPNMDGPEGETHPILGARIMGFLFDRGSASDIAALEHLGRFPMESDCCFWRNFCLYHSRFYAKLNGRPFSRLCVADKLAISLTPDWLYMIQARLTGELDEYMRGSGARTPAGDRTPSQWRQDVKAYCRAWAFEHRDGRMDTWTGTIRDLAIQTAKAKEGK